jgi:hypothetical protein
VGIKGVHSLYFQRKHTLKRQQAAPANFHSILEQQELRLFNTTIVVKNLKFKAQ